MTTYFDGTGKDFTRSTVKLAVARANELEITEYVVASNMGPSAWALIDELGGNGAGVTVVTHSAGFREPFVLEMLNDERKKYLQPARRLSRPVTLFPALSAVSIGVFKGYIPR